MQSVLRIGKKGLVVRLGMQRLCPNRRVLRRRRRTPARDQAHPGVEVLESRTLLTVGLSVGPNVLINPRPGNQSETAIAINPTNPLNVFAIANDQTSSQLFANYSTDGGVTWASSNVAGLPATAGDAQTAWDSFGNLFVTYLNSAVTEVVTIMSSDGGRNFTVINTTSGVVDQPSIAVGPSNFGDGARSVWIAYENRNANGGQGGISVRGAVVTGLGQVTSFISPMLAPGSGQFGSQSGPGNFGNIAVGPDGQVLVAYENPSNTAGPAGLYVNVDSNGFSGGFGPAILVTQTNVGGFAPITPQPDRTVPAGVKIAYDNSGGPNTGRVYMVYTDRAFVADMADTDIYERYSDNDGLAWSGPVLVNDDGPMSKAHFLPALAVDQSFGTPTSGFLAVTWYDARNSPLDNSAQIWGTISINGGQSFLPNVQIGRGLINAHASDPGFEFGDFDLMDFNHGTFYRSWTDNTQPGQNGLNLATAPVTVVFTDSPAAPHVPEVEPAASPASTGPGGPRVSDPAEQDGKSYPSLGLAGIDQVFALAAAEKRPMVFRPEAAAKMGRPGDRTQILDLDSAFGDSPLGLGH